MLESAPLVLEQAPALTESMPAAHAMQRLSVLAGNIGALQMKLKERALASDERAMYANELDRALDDQVATQRHVERVAPDLFAPTGADEQQHLAVVGGPPPLAARRPSPLDGGPARRPPAGRPIGGNASPMLPPSTPMREAPPPPPSTASNNNSPTNGLPPPRSSAHDAPALRVEIPSGDEASRVVFSKPTDVRRNPEAVQALLAAAGLDSSVLDRQSSASLPLSPPLSPRRNDISRPTDVKRNPEAVKALLAGAGIDASVLERADSRQSRTDGASSPVNVGGAADVRLGVGSPMDVRRNPEAVRALLAQAGVDPSSVLKAPPGATNSPVPPLQLPPTVVSDDGATDRYSPKSAALHPALHPVSPQRSPRNEAIVEAKMQEIMALQEATMLAKQQAALAAAQRRPSADVDDGAGGAAGGAPRPRPEAQLSPRSQQQKRLWATHKESATKASLGDYATLYRDTGADVGGDDEDGPPPGPPPSAPAQADKRPPPPRGAPPPSSGGEPRTRLRSFSDAGGDTPPPPLGGVGAAAPFSQHHIPASSVPTTPRGSAVANVFVDLDAPLPGNEMIVSVQVAWNAFTTKVRHQRDDPLLSMRDHIVSLLVSRGQLPAHGDAAVERYQLFRGEGTRRGGKLDLRRSLVANDLAHMSVITIDDIGFVPPPPDEELRRGSSDKRMEKPRTPRSAAAAAASTAGVGGAPAVVVGGASSSAQPPPPPPPPPDGDEESWSDDEGEEYTYEDAPRRSGSDRERRQGGGGSSISAARRTSPLPPAVDALLVLARKKLHAEVERLLPTLTADERHLFKSEIRKRRDAKHRRREGGSSSSKRR